MPPTADTETAPAVLLTSTPALPDSVAVPLEAVRATSSAACMVIPVSGGDACQVCPPAFVHSVWDMLNTASPLPSFVQCPPGATIETPAPPES